MHFEAWGRNDFALDELAKCNSVNPFWSVERKSASVQILDSR